MPFQRIMAISNPWWLIWKKSLALCYSWNMPSLFQTNQIFKSMSQMLHLSDDCSSRMRIKTYSRLQWTKQQYKQCQAHTWKAKFGKFFVGQKGFTKNSSSNISYRSLRWVFGTSFRSDQTPEDRPGIFSGGLVPTNIKTFMLSWWKIEWRRRLSSLGVIQKCSRWVKMTCISLKQWSDNFNF